MKINLETIQFINFFEKLTKTRVKDCFIDENKITFIVNEGQASKAVGKQGINVKRFAEKTNRKVKVIEFNHNPETFIKSMISPIKAEKIERDGNIINIAVNSTKDKGLLIGRNSRNLENLKKVVKKYFEEIEDIKIL